MNSQGVTFNVPWWIFTILVFLPLIAGAFAEILIYLKQRKTKDY